MLLTQEFLNDFKSFMGKYAILIPAQLPPKNGTFQFKEQGSHAALLQSASSGTKIPGYYVHPIANNENKYILPTQNQKPYYMFTDQMNGCQFIAYGPDRQHVTVEHNNFINDRTKYVVRLKEIQNQNPAYLFHMSAGANDDIVNSIYNSQHGVSIVAEYNSTNGWSFRVRDRVDQNQGQVYGPF
ncbi:MAG: hypothetical protein F6K50_18070 [Moorea sp. SIO3I7]|uniref:hypothetical protein n=1 Tax=unclassified Moorena TaxID=2683338 RepID=UPI0013C277FE|nr:MULTISPECIES: hypothetical protein [unclassified Moorena]NEN97362.1 hypothetical protein [Moorena sp. SIO3I7]NEO05425.1 hypothetical protein [Moorena sp. SIO3I8]NEQ61938.1 hypothetical protein [Moorena sp. SIO4A1]